MQTKYRCRDCPVILSGASRQGHIAVALWIAALSFWGVGNDASAAGDSKSPNAKGAINIAKAAPKPATQTDATKSGSIAEQYCKSVRDAVSEARFAFQAAELKALAGEIDNRVAQLELRAVELKDWFTRREEFSKRAGEQLVNIYAAMRPEAASEQLGKMDESTAAAILSKLEPRIASAILNDIPAERAARLATILTGASRKNDRGDKS